MYDTGLQNGNGVGGMDRAGRASELHRDFIRAVAQIGGGGKRAVAPFIVPPGFALAAPGGGQLLLALPDGGAIVREQDVRFENIGERGMDQRPCLHCIMPEPLDAHAGRGVRPRAVSDHRAIGSLAVHAGEENLVIGHAVFGKVKAFGLVRQLIDGKLALVEHLLPGKAQKLEQDVSRRWIWVPPVGPPLREARPPWRCTFPGRVFLQSPRLRRR